MKNGISSFVSNLNWKYVIRDGISYILYEFESSKKDGNFVDERNWMLRIDIPENKFIIFKDNFIVYQQDISVTKSEFIEIMNQLGIGTPYKFNRYTYRI